MNTSRRLPTDHAPEDVEGMEPKLRTNQENHMKRALLASLTIAMLSVPLLSDAQDRGRHDRGRDAVAHLHHGQQAAPDRRGYRAPVVQRNVHVHVQQTPAWHAPAWQGRPSHRYHAPRYAPPRGYQARHWQRGHTLPPSYRSTGYVIDYRHYRLPPPPRGYHYVRVDDHAVLAAIASGLIADVLFGMFYR
jgi:Ni/Co efflux regulator RcnB